jgi:hypothetical protein
MKINNKLRWILLALLPFFQHCKKDTTENSPVVNHPMVYMIDKPGRSEIIATCPPGEQMIGGGYSIPKWAENKTHQHIEKHDFSDDKLVYDEKATVCDMNQGPVFVEASYPSSKNTWTVIVYNPDPKADCYNSGQLIQVNCYCVTSSSLHLNMKILSLAPHLTNLEGASPKAIDNCTVPEGAVVTAGGFKLEPINDIDVGRWGYLPLWGSYPYVNQQNKAIGWTSEYYTTAPARPCIITTYVLYSAPTRLSNGGPAFPGLTSSVTPSPLIDGPVKINDVEKPIGFDQRIGEVTCDPGYFSAGGGFKIIYSGKSVYSAIAHSLPIVCNAEPYINGIRVPFSGWHSEMKEGYDVGSSNGWFSDEQSSVYTLQLKKLPNNIKVVITHPTDGIYLNDGILRRQIKFSGYAIDHDGSYIPNSNLQWEISGAPNGTGEIYKTSIDKNKGAYFDVTRNAERFDVKLTATSKDGERASAYIYLYYQNIVVN